jgi:hypothetical protein
MVAHPVIATATGAAFAGASYATGKVMEAAQNGGSPSCEDICSTECKNINDAKSHAKCSKMRLGICTKVKLDEL